jgi:hypothetical protein
VNYFKNGITGLGLLILSSLNYAEIIFVNSDYPGEGLNSSAVVEPIGGNTGTTLGEQRLKVLEKAAKILSESLNILAPVKVGVQFNHLECYSNYALFGYAGPQAIEYVLETQSATPHSLFNQLSGNDVDPSSIEITARFNSNLDNNDNCLENTNWYYGFDAPSGNDVSLLTLVLHEVAHGMGFTSFIPSDGGMGAWWSDGYGNVIAELFDPFSKLLINASTGERLIDQTEEERELTLINDTNLVWSGDYVNSKASNYNEGVNNGRVQMYAPSSYENGSSTSHFDIPLSPNELMEPFYTDFENDLGLALEALLDIGWQPKPDNPPNYAPVLDAIGALALDEDSSLEVDLSGSDLNNDLLEYSLVSADANIGATINGTSLTLTPVSNFHGTGTLKVIVTDGENIDHETIIVTVRSINDTPIISAIENTEFNIDTSPEIDVIISDVDDTELQITADSSLPSVVSASLENNTLTLNSASIYNGSATITITAFDGEDTTSINFVATVTGGLVAPPLGLTFNESLVENSSVITALDHENISFTITGGDAVYSAEVEFNGVNRSDLLTNDAGNLTLALPDSGAFAGSYELTIDDGNNTTTPITITIERPLRIKTDTSLVLANTNTASIVFEGASPGDAITLSASEIGFSDSTGSTVSTLTASDDADNFNQASAYIDASAAGIFNVIASLANTPDAQKSVTVVSDRTLQLSVNDETSSQIVNALVSIEDERISAWGLSQSYQVNAQGELTLTLPETELELRVSAESYNTKVISSSAQETSRSITLVLADGFYQLNGSVTASDFEFGSESPDITLNLANGNTTEPDSSEISASGVVTYRWLTDLNVASPTSVTFTHSAADDLTITLDSSLGSESIDAELIKTVVEEAPDNGDGGTDTDTDDGSSSSGGGNAAWLLITAIALLRRKRLKARRA